MVRYGLIGFAAAIVVAASRRIPTSKFVTASCAGKETRHDPTGI